LEPERNGGVQRNPRLGRWLRLVRQVVAKISGL
jgi:hypothetical protein